MEGGGGSEGEEAKGGTQGAGGYTVLHLSLPVTGHAYLVTSGSRGHKAAPSFLPPSLSLSPCSFLVRILSVPPPLFLLLSVLSWVLFALLINCSSSSSSSGSTCLSVSLFDFSRPFRPNLM